MLRSASSNHRRRPSAVDVPRAWQRNAFFTLLRMLTRNRFAVRPARWPRVIKWLGLSFLYDSLSGLEAAWFGDLRRSVPVRAPLFVIGHWRSGTTLLHELLSLDDRHAGPTNFQCFYPSAFLLTQRWLPALLGWTLPAHRIPDEMPVGFHLPSEDEFALLWLGAPSPYASSFFPEDRDRHFASLELDGLPPAELELWKEVLGGFLARVQHSAPGRRLVLKSPSHTFRIPHLLEMYPDARFLHIVRCPLSVFPSMIRSTTLAMQKLTRVRGGKMGSLEDLAFEQYRRLPDRLDQARRLVAPERFCEIKYEDLTADAPAVLRRVYEHLSLGDFAPVEPKIRKYFADRSGYRKNRFETSPEQRRQICARLRPIFERYGYPIEE
jgi:hypothetical protein